MSEVSIVQVSTEINGTMDDVKKYFHMAEVLMRRPMLLKKQERFCKDTTQSIDDLSVADLLKETKYIGSFVPTNNFGNMVSVKISKSDKNDSKFLVALTGENYPTEDERKMYEPLFTLAKLYGNSDIAVHSAKNDSYRMSFEKNGNCKEIAEVYSNYADKCNSLLTSAASLQSEDFKAGWTTEELKYWCDVRKTVREAVQIIVDKESASKSPFFHYGNTTLYIDTPKQIFQENLLYTYLSETKNSKNPMPISDFCSNLISNDKYAGGYYCGKKLNMEDVEFMSKVLDNYRILSAKKDKMKLIVQEISRLEKEGWDGKTPLAYKGQKGLVDEKTADDKTKFEVREAPCKFTKSGKPRLVPSVDYEEKDTRVILDANAVEEKISKKGNKFYSTTSLDGTVKYHIPHFLLKPYKVDEKGNPLSYYYTTSNNAVTVQEFNYDDKKKHFVPSARVSLEILYKHFANMGATKHINKDEFFKTVEKTNEALRLRKYSQER